MVMELSNLEAYLSLTHNVNIYINERACILYGLVFQMEFHNNCWGLKISSNGYFHNRSCVEDNDVFIIVLFNGSI